MSGKHTVTPQHKSVTLSPNITNLQPFHNVSNSLKVRIRKLNMWNVCQHTLFWKSQLRLNSVKRQLRLSTSPAGLFPHQTEPRLFALASPVLLHQWTGSGGGPRHSRPASKQATVTNVTNARLPLNSHWYFKFSFSRPVCVRLFHRLLFQDSCSVTAAETFPVTLLHNKSFWMTT